MQTGLGPGAGELGPEGGTQPGLRGDRQWRVGGARLSSGGQTRGLGVGQGSSRLRKRTPGSSEGTEGSPIWDTVGSFSGSRMAKATE